MRNQPLENARKPSEYSKKCLKIDIVAVVACSCFKTGVFSLDGTELSEQQRVEIEKTVQDQQL